MEAGSIQELSTLINMKIDTLVVGSLQENCYVVTIGNNSFIVDPGDEAERIINACKDKNIKEKRMIAKKAVELIHDGDMIFLDTSTTNIELAREIIERRLEVTVVSCMLDIAEVFTATKNVKFILLGGEFNRSQNGFLGELVLQMMENFRFDISFMGVVGANLYDNAIMTYVPEDGIMKHNAVKKSSKCYLMMESHKFDFKANYVYATFDDVDGVICEDGLSKEIQDKLETYQTKII